MIDLNPIKARLAAATSGPWRITKWDRGDLVADMDGEALSLLTIRDDDMPVVKEAEDAEFIAHARTDMKELVAEVERLRKRVLGSLGAVARELSWRARYMDQLAIVAELQAELRERQRKDRAMLDYRATAKEAGIAQEKLPGALRELARENERLKARLDAVPVEFEEEGA